MEQFSASDIMLIEKEISRKPYKEIAFLIDKTEPQLRQFLNTWLEGRSIVVYQQTLDLSRRYSAPAEKKVRAPKEKKKKERKIESRLLTSSAPPNRRRGEPHFKTKVVDYSKMVRVNIDDKTAIYIKPGQDPKIAKQLFLQRLADKHHQNTKV
jgi:hypothetical protein